MEGVLSRTKRVCRFSKGSGFAPRKTGTEAQKTPYSVLDQKGKCREDEALASSGREV